MKAIVTDDSKATRMILARLLLDLGFEVELACDGTELIERLAAGTVDLCLIDWNMPGLNGTELVKMLKAHPDWREITSIIVTDETKQARIDSALEAGAAAYLPKPFNSAVLASILTRIGVQLPEVA